MRCTKYRQGVEWIALNDNYTACKIGEIRRQMTVELLASLYDLHPDDVAADVVKARHELGTN